jgi:integrase
MAFTRQLPSGLWAATVRLPTGKRVTQSHALKSVIGRWAAELEQQVAIADWIDPRAGKITVGQWWERAQGARRLEKASAKRDESQWRNHVAPYWRDVPIGSILKPDVTRWVNHMEARRVGAATIHGAVGVLRGLLELAVDARLIRSNPARGVAQPAVPAHLDRVLGAGEDDLLLESLDRQFPGRPDARLFVEVLLYCGLRWEEAAAVDRTRVDMRRQLIHVGPVVERDGTIRPYPKSPAGERPVPVPLHLWSQLRDHALTVEPGGLLFTAPGGGGAAKVSRGTPTVLRYSNWHRRVWQPGLREVLERGPRGQILHQHWVLDDPQPTPHDLRHTYGTRLGEQGVPQHEIMALMGHESMAASGRYLHARDGRFDRARAAVEAARTLRPGAAAKG